MVSFVLISVLPMGWIVPGARADGGGFSNRDLDGPKAFSFDGIIFQVVDDPEVPVPVPVTAVGQFDAKNGRVELLKRTLNVGGVLIVTQEFAGVADVREDGTGTAKFCSTKRTLPPAAPGDAFPTVTYEEFSFGISGEDNSEVEFIGTRLIGGFDPNADCNLEDEGGGIVNPVAYGVSVCGIARTQYVNDDDDD